MSKILIPYINHTSLNHKFYIQCKHGNGLKDSTCFWTGMYPELSISNSDICSQFADKLLCYDTCIISELDYLFLINTIGFNIVQALLEEGAIELIDNTIKVTVPPSLYYMGVVYRDEYIDAISPQTYLSLG